MVTPLRPRFIIPGDEFMIGAKIFPERELVVLREMTKMFEERKVGKPAELLDLLKDKKRKRGQQ